MADLGVGQRAIVMPHYPHMLAEDVAVWTRFLEVAGSRISRVWYDVHVGRPIALPEGASELERKVAAGISRKRIDVVGLVVEDYWVIEVKPFGSMLALGQVVAYSDLFVEEFGRDRPVVPTVVCGVVDDDVVSSFEREGVQVFEVGGLY